MYVFFFNDTATTEIYTLSLHDALPISEGAPGLRSNKHYRCEKGMPQEETTKQSVNRSKEPNRRSEEHTSELQSRLHLVCRLLLEKKKTQIWNLMRPHNSH